MNSTNSPVPFVDVLLVEDNEDDIELIEIALQQDGKLINRLHVTRDGVEGLAFLRQQGKYADALRPGLVLLDLNMPRMDGREMLAAMKADENLRRIPVVVLTTSESDADVLKAYDLHANCYITKPVEFSKFVEATRQLADYWFALVKLPPNGAAHH